MSRSSTDRLIVAYLIAIGAVLLVAAWIAAEKGSDAAAATLSLFGGGCLVLAPFAPALEGKIKLGPLIIRLRERLVEASAAEDEGVLEGVIAFLEGDEVTAAVRPIRRDLAGHRLTDSELQFLRQELNLSVVAVRLPGERNWRAGGQITNLQLPGDAQLLLVGPPDSFERYDSP